MTPGPVVVLRRLIELLPCSVTCSDAQGAGHRWTILALLAHAFLSVLAASQRDGDHAGEDQLIPLTSARTNDVDACKDRRMLGWHRERDHACGRAGTKKPQTPLENSPAANRIGGTEPFTS